MIEMQELELFGDCWFRMRGSGTSKSWERRKEFSFWGAMYFGSQSTSPFDQNLHWICLAPKSKHTYVVTSAWQLKVLNQQQLIECKVLVHNRSIKNTHVIISTNIAEQRCPEGSNLNIIPEALSSLMDKWNEIASLSSYHHQYLKLFLIIMLRP
jgi:hypothetical protein